jgi:hypothetical protein
MAEKSGEAGIASLAQGAGVVKREGGRNAAPCRFFAGFA